MICEILICIIFFVIFQAKSEEARMLDLISEEINRLIDMQYDEEFSVDVNRLEIPLTQLMTVVHHITTDIDRVRLVIYLSLMG